MDLKVGVRMLVKYPGLTLVGVLAMAFAIGAGAAGFEVIKRVLAPDLPLPEGDRIVGFTFTDRTQGAQKPLSAHDLLSFRESLRTVRNLGAYRFRQQNLLADGVTGEPVAVAEISASAFMMTRIAAASGRTLVEADEAPGAPPVMLLGHRLWQTRFAGDPSIVGRTVRLGDGHATVVGVMPEGYRFPVDDQLWVPLRTAELAREPGRDPLRVFGKLAPGVSREEAQAEVTTVIQRSALAWPDHYKQVTPQVLRFTESVIAIPSEGKAGMFALNLLAGLFLMVVCGNVALLMFARAATREKELLVRTALGATRGRIVGMLFLEALVLSGIAAIVGLVAAAVLLDGAAAMLRTGPDRWPFWLDGGLTFTTVLYAALLALCAAAIAGVVPGLKVMGRGLWDRMRQSGGGGGGLRMGGVWTGVIIAQIAVMILFSAVAYVVQRQAAYIAAVDASFPSKEFVSARLELDPVGNEARDGVRSEAFLRRYTATVHELERRLSREPQLASVTLAEQLPRMPAPLHRIESEDAVEADPTKRHVVQASNVDPGFFAVFQMPVVAGRGFDSRDLVPNARPVIVNLTFVEQVLHGRNAVGRRIRFSATRETGANRPETQPRPWLEIVGVVRDLAPREAAPLNLDNPTRPRVYLPLDRAAATSLFLAIHARTGIEAVVPHLRRIAAEVDPTLRLHEVQSLEQATNEDARFWTVFAKVIVAGSMLTLLLSLAGIYAVMSFTVSRRTREIGVRAALGGRPLRIIGEIFRRPFRQVAAGIALGWTILAVLVTMTSSSSGASVLRHAPLMAAYGLLIAVVCALACLGPIRRALRVQPIEALRQD
jgi:putative ABC transport system permease protein